MDIVIIKRYNSSLPAYVDAGLLRDNGIECEINGENLINVMPMTSEPITLNVRAQDEAMAQKLLSNSDAAPLD